MLVRHVIPFACLASACLVASSCRKKEKSGPVVTRESERQRTEGVQAAFIERDNSGAKAVATDSKQFQEIDAVFSALGKACRAKDATAFVSRLSPEAMVHLMEENGYVKPKGEKDRKEMIQGLKAGLSRSFVRLAYDRHELVRLERTAPGQVMAFTRLHDDEKEVIMKFRWWLIEEQGAWRIYDFEDLDQGIRTSTLMGSMMAASLGGKGTWMSPFMAFVKRYNAMTEEEKAADTAKVRGEVEAILKEGPPAEVESYIRVILISALQANGEHEACLGELEKLAKLPNASPMGNFLKGVSLSALDRHAEAVAAFGAYGEELGWDRDVHESVADCHLAAGDKEKALEHALKGLADSKDSAGCLATAAVAAGAGRIGELKPHFDATSDPESAYEVAIDYALECEDEDTAKAVFGLLKEKLPASDLVEAYEEVFAEGEGEKDE